MISQTIYTSCLKKMRLSCSFRTLCLHGRESRKDAPLEGSSQLFQLQVGRSSQNVNGNQSVVIQCDYPQNADLSRYYSNREKKAISRSCCRLRRNARERNKNSRGKPKKPTPPPKNGLVVKRLIPVAYNVLNARTTVINNLKKLLKVVPVHACKWCNEIHVGPSGHPFRSCNGSNTSARRGAHEWTNAVLEDILVPLEAYHLYDRLGKRIPHEERFSIPRIPIYSEGKGKKVPTSNEKLLLSLRKACSIIELQKNALSQTIGATDKTSVELGSSSPSRCDTGNGDAQTAECTSLLEVQESNKNINSSISVVNLPLNQPRDVLNRLSLPPSKDLDLLLLDATKPSSSSRNNSDLRLGKLGSWRSGLPPFPWSQSSSTHPKSGLDAVKLTSSRNSCQGRWVKVENSVNHPNDTPRVVVDLESLTFDTSLVPSLTRKMPPSESEKTPSESFGLPTNQIANSSALCSTSHDQPVEHSPSVLDAARTLYGIASSVMQNLPEKQKKPSEKQLSKIYKSKAKNRESRYHQFVVPKATAGSESISNDDVMERSKKLKLSIDVRNNLTNGAYPSKKVPLYPSTLQSVRSSPAPGKSSVPEMRNASSNGLNRSCTMPPPSSRVMNNASGSRVKL